MREYERKIVVTSHGPAFEALLKVIRLPNSWYAVIWTSPEKYKAISQDATPKNGGFAHMHDSQFLGQVQLVAGFSFGIEFDYMGAV
ncbi:hypothetical protein G6K98_15955 [Agrobacterium rhizogenes]|nr:hypothetical protein [Rhizobium rhizogenes]NTH59489.1 hypothetical protein [Rhizobium rhizogenes]NTH90640.1 hypothetical protein [Rhizobium rhizogenes]